MTKYKVTKKAIRESGDKVYAVGYCNMQYLLTYKNPFAYSSRSEGWACDYYQVSPTEIVSTGYAPIGKQIPYEVTKRYENMAQHVYHENYGDCRKELDELLAMMLEEVRK